MKILVSVNMVNGNTNKYNVAMPLSGIKIGIKQVKSKNSCKLIGQEYFGVITQNSIFFVASMEAKNQLNTSYSF